jgi:hypothetical protein
MCVGIEPARCIWLGSYLSGRIQKIWIGDAGSKDIKVTLGVPQGPLCLIWFVNRISEILDFVSDLFYADDMKLFLPVSGFQDCLKIQSDLNKLSEGCNRNSLLLNVGKCKTITFARSRHPVKLCLIGELHKRSRSHHGRENDLFGPCGRHGCKGLCDARTY